MHFSKNVSWHKHTAHALSKAIRMLGFIKRHLKDCPASVNKTQYISSIRSILGYARCVWDPRQQYLQNKLEKIKNRAAKFISHVYGTEYSISKIKRDLDLVPLPRRRICQRLKSFHNTFHNHSGTENDTHLFRPHYVSFRVDRTNKKREIYKCNTFQQTFIPPLIKVWNSLRDEIISTP